MNEKLRSLVRKLDTAGLEERCSRVQKQLQEQQIAAESAEAYRRGFDSAYAEQRRKIQLRDLAQADPAMYFFLVKNRSVEST
jgi:hypothetical protein